MVDRRAIGVAGEPFHMPVERGKVREFARAVGAADPEYLERPDPLTPPTFLTTMRLWQDERHDAWRLVGFDPRRVLHAEQAFEFHGPPPTAGQTLSAQSRIADIYEKVNRGGDILTFAVMVTEFRDEHDRVVATATLTGVETPARPAAGS